jgi:hypothetical protein
MKIVLLYISLALGLQTQDVRNVAEFKDFYAWAQSPDFDDFIQDTVKATEGQVILRFDDVLFTGTKSFRDFFESVASQYKIRFDRIELKGGDLSVIRPEDLMLSLANLNRMIHLWNHIFKNLADNQITMYERINRIDSPEIRTQMLRGWGDNLDQIIRYYSRWMPKIAQFYFAEKSWVRLIKGSGMLSSYAESAIKPELFSDDIYGSIDQFVPTLRGLRIAFNASASLQRSNSSPIGRVPTGHQAARKASATNIG